MLAVSMAAGMAAPAMAEETAEVQKGGTLVVAFPQTIATMDHTKTTILHENNCGAQVCESLFMYNDDLSEYVPVLATEWSVSEDGLTYYFTIRDDVSFSNGRKMTAADVKYSLDRTKWPESTQDFARGYYDYTEVLDDTHVAVHLSSPCAPFMSYVAGTVGSIVPQEEVEAAGDKWGRDILIGTGPFLLKEFVTDEYVIFEKNPNYWGEEPNVDGIKVLFISDPVQMFNALKTGEVHVGFDMAGDVLPGLIESGMLSQCPANAINWARFNMQGGPTADPRVRQALLMAVDVEEMNEGIYQYDEANEIFMPLPPHLFAYDESLAEYKVEYDPEGAKKLLKEAGYGKGLHLTLVMPTTASRNKMAQILQSYWEEIGVDLTIRSTTTPEFVNTIMECYKEDKVNIVAATWNANPDPSFYLNRFFHTRYWSNSSNPEGYGNETVDKWLDDAFKTSDQAERKALYRNVLETVLKDYAGLWYSNELRNYGITPKVHGISARPDNKLDVCTPISNVWIEK